ncbi:MAG: hypothetical protein AAGA75_28660, partial [Cyanobacteria bacterium P01_E01_bin.6]
MLTGIFKVMLAGNPMGFFNLIRKLGRPILRSTIDGYVDRKIRERLSIVDDKTNELTNQFIEVQNNTNLATRIAVEARGAVTEKVVGELVDR